MSRMKDEPQEPLPRPSKAYEVELVHKALAAGVNPSADRERAQVGGRGRHRPDRQQEGL